MRNAIRKICILLPVVLAGIMLTPISPAQAEPAAGTYNLINDWHTRCMAGRITRSVVIFDCVDTFTDQFWQLEPFGAPGYFRIRNVHTGQCLAMPGWDNGSKAAMFDCIDSYYDQWWLPEVTPNSTYRFRNYKTGKCLAVSTTGSGNGRSVIQYTCTLNFNDQWWHIWPLA